MKKFKTGKFVEVDSSCIHYDKYLYPGLERGKKYEVIDIAYTKRDTILHVRDNNNIAVWIDSIFMKRVKKYENIRR